MFKQIANNRIYWIDIAKFLGIYLVILGHSGLLPNATNIIYSFHMPLFFFLSGYLFSIHKFSSLKVFIKKRADQLIKPYLYFSLITYIFWLFIGRKFGQNAKEHISIYTPIIGTLYGSVVGFSYIHAAALWFLPCLFSVEIIYFIISKLFNSKIKIFIAICGSLIAGFIISQHQTYRFPWGIDAALIAVFFYWIGNQFKEISSNIILLRMTAVTWIVLFIILGICLYFFVPINGRVDLGGNFYKIPQIYIVNAILGIAMIYCLANSLKVFILDFFVFISKNTIIIIAFQGIAFSIIKGVFSFIFKLPADFGNLNLTFHLLLSFLNLLICMVPIFLINKFFPWILGSVSKKNI